MDNTEKENHMLLDTKGLMRELNCGKPTALRIGRNAHAKVHIGRRILWNTQKIKQYIDSIAE